MSENPNRAKRIADIHMHIVPDVDDGSGSMKESMMLLRLAVEQGVGTIIATPHSWAIDECGMDHALTRFRKLQKAAGEIRIPVELYPGCEMLVFPGTVDLCIDKLDDGRYPTLAGSRYVLTEFMPTVSQDDMELCIEKIAAARYIPVIAHAERYENSTADGVRTLKKLGAMVQINAYSIANEQNKRIRDLANALLSERLADFIGSDAHRLNHRPPIIAQGIATLREQYPENYVKRVVSQNADELLITRSEKN